MLFQVRMDVHLPVEMPAEQANQIKAVEKAKEMGVTSVILTSTKYSGNHGDFVLKVPSKKTELIQHAHTAIGHSVCELIESALLP